MTAALGQRDIPAADLLAGASRITRIDRRYLQVEIDGAHLSIAELAELVAGIAARPTASWEPAEIDLLLNLYALGAARIRLEQVGMRLDRAHIEQALRDSLDCYRSFLGDSLVPDDAPAAWWQLADTLSELRPLLDHGHHRVLQIDGSDWARHEQIVPRAPMRGLPGPLASALSECGADADDLAGPSPALSLAALARGQLDQHGHPLGLLTLIMRTATIDPVHRSDHATLMLPRGTRLAGLDQLEKADFGILMVFAPDFDPATYCGPGDEATIQRAMYAHHSAKKKRIATRLYGRTGVYEPDEMSDDLGSKGIYFNEGAHHKGHVIAGVSSAMRSLMNLTLDAPHAEPVIHDLCDWRLARADATLASRYELSAFPAFYNYGLCLKTVVETSLNDGYTFPKLLGDWR